MVLPMTTTDFFQVSTKLAAPAASCGEPVASRAAKDAFLRRMMAATNLSVTTKLVGLALLLQFYDPDTGQCNPSARAICNAANLSNKTVFGAIAHLKSAGWITVEGSQGGTPQHTNKYFFLFDRVKPASPAARVSA
jgi:Helix-turn-helix domain